MFMSVIDLKSQTIHIELTVCKTSHEWGKNVSTELNHSLLMKLGKLQILCEQDAIYLNTSQKFPVYIIYGKVGVNKGIQP